MHRRAARQFDGTIHSGVLVDSPHLWGYYYVVCRLCLRILTIECTAQLAAVARSYFVAQDVHGSYRRTVAYVRKLPSEPKPTASIGADWC